MIGPSLLLSTVLAASAAAPAPMPSYAAALEALTAQGRHPTQAMEAGALAAMRQALSREPARTSVLAADHASSPGELAAELPPGAPDLHARLEEAALQGLVKASGDPGARLLPPMWSPRPQAEPVYAGIGIRFATTTAGLRIDEIIARGPAAEGGLVPGDTLVAVDGEPLAGLSGPEAAGLIRGVAGTPVRLTLDRAGQVRQDLVLTRRTIDAAPAPEPEPESSWPGVMRADLIDDRILYLKLASLDGADYRSGLTWALKQHAGAKGLVFDLRGCQGGHVQQIPDLVGQVAGAGPLFTLVDRQRQAQTLTAKADNVALARVPLAVLVDRTTSAGGELLAFSLRVSRRAALVGETTAGNGAVQTFKRLPNGMRLALTTHEAILGNGQPLKIGGIRPDIPATTPSREARQPAWVSLVPPPTRDIETSDMALAGAIEYIRSKQEQDAQRR